MKLDILTFCLLCFHFEPLHSEPLNGADNCSSFPFWKRLCKDLPDSKLENLPRDTLIFQCPLPNSTNFHMKLFKGKEEVCDLYLEDEEVSTKKTEFCNPLYFSDCVVKFMLSNLQNKHSDTYTCYLEIFMPLYKECKAKEIYLHIQDPEHCLISEMKSWTLIGLSVFSTAVCICCFLACCLRKMICQKTPTGSSDYSNEYMSMAAVKFS